MKLAISPALLIAVSVQLLSQAFKVVYYSVKAGRMQWHRFVHPAGMPSAHAAFVTALVVSIAVIHGPASDLFTLAFVFSVIVIYDTLRLRGAVQTLARIVRRLSHTLPEPEREHVPDYIGHTRSEIVVGVLIGGLWGLFWTWALSPG